MNYKLDVYCISDIGCVREQNEDMILCGGNIIRDSKLASLYSKSDFPLIFAVADGMGGHNAGEIASEFAINKILNFKEFFSSLIFLDFKSSFEKIIGMINDDLLKMGNYDPLKKDLGTTLTGIVFSNNYISTFNIGDSRIYKLRGGFLNQITKDHSLSQETQMDFVANNILTNCLGGGIINPYVDIESIAEKLVDEDIYLICSDGLYNMISTDDLEKILDSNKILNEIGDELVSIAKKNGGKDNVSLILIKLLK